MAGKSVRRIGHKDTKSQEIFCAFVPWWQNPQTLTESVRRGGSPHPPRRGRPIRIRVHKTCRGMQNFSRRFAEENSGEAAKTFALIPAPIEH